MAMIAKSGMSVASIHTGFAVIYLLRTAGDGLLVFEVENVEISFRIHISRSGSMLARA
jgi:hypothetical protein